MDQLSGRSQREAVNVIFRLLLSLRKKDIRLSEELLERLCQLDSSGIHVELSNLIAKAIDAGADEKSLDAIRCKVGGTPFESAFFEEI